MHTGGELLRRKEDVAGRQASTSRFGGIAKRELNHPPHLTGWRVGEGLDHVVTNLCGDFVAIGAGDTRVD